MATTVHPLPNYMSPAVISTLPAYHLVAQGCTIATRKYLFSLLIWFMASSQERAVVLFVGCCLATKSFQWYIHLSYTPQTEQQLPFRLMWLHLGNYYAQDTLNHTLHLGHRALWMRLTICKGKMIPWDSSSMHEQHQATSHWSWYEASWNLKPCLFRLLAYSGSNKQYMVEIKWNWIKLAVSGLNCPHTLTTELRDYWEQPPAHNLVGLQLTDL